MSAFYRLRLPDGKEIQLPIQIRTNGDVYNHVNKLTQANLILYLNSIPIPPKPTINLIDIGYDIQQILIMEPYTIKDISFEVANYKYIYTEEVKSYQTVYDIKKIFAKHFKTIAQNIVIKHTSNILPDNTNIIDTGSIFEVDVIEGFSLYYYHFFNFGFICMPNNSSMQDLKNKLAGYSFYFERGIQYVTHDDITFSDYQKSIEEFANKTPFLDFGYESSNSPMITTIRIEPKDKRKDAVFKYQGPFPCLEKFPNKQSEENTIAAMKNFLEKSTHISSKYLVNFDNKQFKFVASKPIYAKVGQKDYKFDYTTTIEHIKELFGPKESKQNIGIIINGRFAHKNSDFLCKYLRTAGNSETSRLQINLLIPSEPCRLCEFEILPRLTKKRFIIPVLFSYKSIAEVYFKQKPELMAFYPGFCQKSGPKPNPLDKSSKLEETSLTEFSVSTTKDVIINYQLDGENKDRVATLQYDDESPPRIKDLLFKIALLHPNPFHSYDAYIGSERICFMEFVAEHADQKFIIKSYEYQEGTNEKCLKVYYAPGNEIIEYKEKINEATAEQIIDKIRKDKGIEGSLSLYLNFMKLAPGDKPLVLSLPTYCLILNEDSQEEEFYITNGKGIDIKQTFQKAHFPIMQAVVQQIFALTEKVSLSLKLDKFCKLSKAYSQVALPYGFFDAGSIPKNSIICIGNYEVPESNELTFSYNGSTKTIELSDTKKMMQDLSKEIIDKLKICRISQRAAAFSFLGTRLNPKRSFISYGILPKAPITVTHADKSVKVEVRQLDDTLIGQFFFSQETNKDTVERIKQEYGKVKLYKPIERNDVIYALFEKVTIKLLDPKGEQQVKIDEILSPSGALLQKLADKVKLKPDDFTLFKCEHPGHYTKVNTEKTFKELGETEFFALKTIKGITLYFKENEIKIYDTVISEFESVQSLIEYFISNKIMASPKNIMLVIDNAQVGEKETVGKLLQMAEGKKINIELKVLVVHTSMADVTGQPSSQPPSATPSPPKKKKVNLKKFMPKTSEIRNSIKESDISKSESEMKEAIKQHEEEDQEPEEPWDPLKHRYLIKDGEELCFALGKEATIADAAEEIARLVGDDTDPNCVSIILANKKLRRTTVIDDLNLNRDVVLHVLIEPIDFFMRAARALRIINPSDLGKADDDEYEYEYVYEEDEEEAAGSSLKKSDNEETIKILDTNLIELLESKSKKIDEGATSIVYKVENIFTHKGFLALKVLKDVIFKQGNRPKSKGTKSKSIWDEEEDLSQNEEEEDIKINFEEVKKLYAENELLNYLNHPNIIKTYGFYNGDRTRNPSILLEYCRFNLEEIIKELHDFELVGIIYEICSAMKYVHDNKIIHRDLKMSNILINLKKHVKICDFGIAKAIDLTTYTSMTHGIGTLRFIAPELLIENYKYNEKVDVYSFGVIMYFIVTKGEMPPLKLSGYESVKLPETINSLSQEIIKSCWSKEPDNRPSFDEILQTIIKNNFMVIDGIQSKIPQIKEHLGIE
ncbi:hypothetical protein M9Y10_032043 [Tritrichomonas musculus]|uniref:Protein kinase domain-containing protein n=1 Tax=Tritrichomonas musculus TaxID=1915356 RepID=A0ABR2H0I7_9EUKA